MSNEPAERLNPLGLDPDPRVPEGFCYCDDPAGVHTHSGPEDIAERLAAERRATVERIRAATHADPRPLAASIDAILDAEAQR